MKSSAKAKSAVAKKRKIDAECVARFKDDEDEQPTRPKVEPEVQRPVKHEPTANLDIGLPTTNYAMAGIPGAGLDPPNPQYTFSSNNSIFDEFCTPEMFSQHSYDETLHPEQHSPVPRTFPNMDSQSRELVMRTGVAPQDSIIIAD